MGHWDAASPFPKVEYSNGITENGMPNSAATSSAAASAAAATASSTDACISIVHSLMCHRQGGESEAFAKRAIECLVKKLKDKPDELDALIQAVTLNGSQLTKCATIPRTLDGRLQVAGKKVFPHVIYARIWRWSDIQKSELKKITFCHFAFDDKLDNVCVNPYHYERVISPGLDLYLPGLGMGDGNHDDELYEFDDINSPQSSMMNGGPRMFGLGELPSMLAPPGPSLMENRKPTMNVNHGGTMNSNGMGSDQYPPLPPPPPHGELNNLYHPGSGTLMMNHPPPPPGGFWNHGLPPPPGSSMLPLELQDYKLAIHEQRMFEQSQQTLRYEEALRKQQPPDYWCTISYFEMDQQVGETFKVRNAYTSLTVDGYADPSHSDRFCLGPLTNVHRTEASEKARIIIGKGICLTYREDHSVWLNVHGTGEADSYSMFAQSYYLDFVQNRAPGEAVHKIGTGTQLKIFDLEVCYHHMLQQLHQAQAIQCAQAQAVTGNFGAVNQQQRSQQLSPVPGNLPALTSSSGIGADDLRRLCVLRLSFVKGWGPDYGRKTIKETPCWIEVQVNRALVLLDDVLRSAPSNEPRSMTEYS
ncbi:Mothers against decapentaplegic-like protein 4 [Hypsibius exemplaris]|uniref:Mothers against decapentaplegic homolog n=1 Tax=Hypsibius exemplaris TaxID=2072580 RepID=A0A9X6RMS6_HYPEX|nr:Mothers against decapentaplegic-like protein 4 [Hypsibius exemplaris]